MGTDAEFPACDPVRERARKTMMITTIPIIVTSKPILNKVPVFCGFKGEGFSPAGFLSEFFCVKRISPVIFYHYTR
jgi:hypothetical protein